MAADWSPNRYVLPGEVLVYPKVVLNLAAGESVDDDIAAAIPEDVREETAARDLHIVIVAPLAHSEEYSDVEGVRVVPVHPPPGYQTRVLSAGVNYAQVRALLARCDGAHGAGAPGGGEDDGAESMDFPFPDLMVIDCESEQLVPAWAGCRFAALSYVWGHPREGGHDEDDEEEPFQTDLRSRRRPLPRTVRDAMHVVQELGLQFLWVDRYCIDDNDDDDGDGDGGGGAAGASKHRKHHTISNMDAVYQRAALTIVAASGAHSDHGLPGARRIHRRLDTYSLAENGGRGEGRAAYVYIEEAHAELSELVWSTRGWTYQEGLLSQHRLVFTESQATFQCQHNNNSSSSRLVERAADIFYRIEEYTRRRLTYPADSLRAFLGVLRAFEKLSPPAEHLWGVPFIFGADGKPRQPAQGLLWKSQLRGLRRIAGIPSWSWAGWDGWAGQQHQHAQQHQQVRQEGEGVDPKGDHSVWMYGLLPADPSLADLDDALIEVPSAAGAPLGLEGYFRAQREGRGRRGSTAGQHAIYVTAWTAEVSFAPGSRRREYVLDLDARSDFGLGTAPETAGGGGEKAWTVAVICWAHSRPAHRAERGLRTQCLVLEREGTDSLCRVGTLETRWRKDQLQEDGEGRARIAAWGRHFLRRRLRIV